MSALDSAGAMAGLTLFQNVVTDLYELAKDRTSRKLKKWNAENKIRELYKNIAEVRKVKTIWQVDKPVDLMEFYCDSHVKIDGSRRVVRSLEDFGSKENLLIEGIAGQGKSIFLRYLCATELARGEYIPLFVELRHIDESQSLEDRILTAFRGLGLEVDENLCDTLMESGKVLLLLDAFDEIPEDLKNSVLVDIQDLATTKKNLQIVLTSRPHETARVSTSFNIVELDDLREKEYAQVSNDN